MDLYSGTVIFIVGFLACWAAAVTLIAGLIMLRVARTMKHHSKHFVELEDAWRDM